MNHLASPYTVSYVVEIGSVNIWKFLSLGTKFTSSQEMKQSSATLIMTLGEQCFHLLLLISLLSKLYLIVLAPILPSTGQQSLHMSLNATSFFSISCVFFPDA